MENAITDKMLGIWLRKYNDLDRASDKWMEKLEKAEAEHNEKREKIATERINELIAEMNGMEKALNIFGYETRYQRGTFVIVEASYIEE